MQSNRRLLADRNHTCECDVVFVAVQFSVSPIGASGVEAVFTLQVITSMVEIEFTVVLYFGASRAITVRFLVLSLSYLHIHVSMCMCKHFLFVRTCVCVFV